MEASLPLGILTVGSDIHRCSVDLDDIPRRFCAAGVRDSIECWGGVQIKDFKISTNNVVVQARLEAEESDLSSRIFERWLLPLCAGDAC